MKRMLSLCAAALCLALALTPTALAAAFEPAVPDAKVCYPTAIVRGDDGTELKKIYDLSPEDDPAGIPRSDFRQDGFKRSAGAGSLYKTGKIGKAQGFFQFFPYPFGGKVDKLSFRRHPGNQFKRFRRRSKIELGGKPAKAENP